ncbi:MAG: leucine-rich repeat protein [Muribaculaceae bacterium]|nr:leucine-rich repeat protein [Muribaculaceae bacterium]
MRKLFLISILSLGIATAQGVTVTTTAGGLSQVATNPNETSLTINGSLDARDFRFIADHLVSLQTLDLTGVTIEAYNGTHAVFGNQLTYPAGEIPTMALAGHQHLRQVTLPATATGVGIAAFAGCRALATVTMGAQLATIGSHAFAGCPALTTVTLPSSLQVLGEEAFLRCTALKTVLVGNGNATTLRIGDGAFMGCSALNAVTFSSGLATLGNRVFAGTGLKTLDFTTYGNLQAVGDYAFVKSQATTVKFPKNVAQLGRGTFLYSPIASVSMPKALKRVPGYAFAGANQLGTLDMGTLQLDSVGEYALYGASKVSAVVLPSTVSYIGTRAMAGMTGLTTLRSKSAQVPALGENVWEHVDQSTVKLYVPTQAVEGYQTADQWKYFDVLASFLRGDANNDGMVDIGDVNAIINHMLGKPSTEEFFFEAGDTDSNGIIDIDDVNYVINVILKRIDNNAPRVPDTDDLVTIDDFTIEAGQTRTVAVKLSHAARYTALQCDIVLPEGLTVVEDGITAASNRHLLASSNDDGNVRIACYSLEGSTLPTGDDTVIHLTVEASQQLSGEPVIAIERAVLGTASSVVRHCDNSYAQVNVSTAVSEVKAATSRAWVEGSTLIIESEQPTQAQLVAISGMVTTLAVMDGHNEYSGIEPGVYVVRLNGQSHKVVVR